MPKKAKKKKRGISRPEPLIQSLKYKLPPLKQKPKYYNKKPIFAFTYYVDPDKNWSFRCINDCKKFWVFFKKLKDMCSMSWGQIQEAHPFHAHEVGWSKKTIPSVVKKIEKIEEIKDYPLYQFRTFNECRILGLFNSQCVFEIIYVDKKHETFPSK